MLFEKYRPSKLEDVIGIPQITNRIKEFINSPDGIPHLMFIGKPGTGKALTLDSDILTIDGFVKMSSVRVGMKVIGSNGIPCNVIGVFPQGIKRIIRLKFSDETFVDSSEDHLWETSTISERKNKTSSVKTTLEIANSVMIRDKYNHSINLIAPVMFESHPLPIDPYVLGVFIGDGSFSKSVRISNPEIDVMEKFQGLLSNDDKIRMIKNTKMEWIVSRKIKNNKKSEMAQQLVNIGYSECKSAKDKFIPKNYLINSVENRISLLQGLIDTDGSIETRNGNSHVSYTTVSKQLMEDVVFLTKSLGAQVYVSQRIPSYTYNGEKRKGQLSYTITMYFYNGIVPCSSKKQLGKYIAPCGKYNKKYILSATEIDPMPCQCIYVDSPDHLFATTGFNLTHNTTLAKIIGKTVLANATGDFYEFNASNDRGIDFIRTVIAEIAKRKPLGSSYKIILMDEADNITDDAQAAFRRILEQFASNCRFIFTCNFPGKIIEAIKSRFVKFEFQRPTPETVLEVLKKVNVAENLKISDAQLKKYSEDARGDFRNALTILEGQIPGGSNESWKEITIESLRKMPVEKRIELCFLADAEMIFQKIWECVQAENAWSLVPLLCDCQHKMNMSIHKTLFLINLMRQIA